VVCFLHHSHYFLLLLQRQNKPATPPSAGFSAIFSRTPNPGAETAMSNTNQQLNCMQLAHEKPTFGFESRNCHNFANATGKVNTSRKKQ